jgi:hypothetical protein
VKNDPYIMKARFSSTCPETGNDILKGEDMAYYPKARKAYHADSRAFEEVRALQFAVSNHMPDCDW